MLETGPISLIIILAIIFISHKAFKSHDTFDRLSFRVDEILIRKEYYRLLSSGFVHVSWSHLLFNMMSLYFFSSSLEYTFGFTNFLGVYFGALLGGNLMALFIHRKHGDYSAVGASGAVSGIIFAAIAITPGMKMSLLFLPIAFPAWLFAIIFLAITLYGIKSQSDNIGHESHLGGALIGMITAILIYPNVFIVNYLVILIILIPSIIFLILIVIKPEFLLIDNLFHKNHRKHYTIEHVYNEKKVNSQAEIDRILDKISKKGMSSLNKKEKEILDNYSKR